VNLPGSANSSGWLGEGIVVAKQESRKTKRNQAARARAREQHFRLVIERQGDPAFVQQTFTPTGRTIKLPPQDAAMLKPLLEEQREAFVEKFGREPGPEDPLFFDPDKDEPTFLDPAAVAPDMFDDLRAKADEIGVDRALIDAWEELGYVITEANEHRCSPRTTSRRLTRLSSGPVCGAAGSSPACEWSG
jgi:hypothetical protein